jgi:hypothetical protein
VRPCAFARKTIIMKAPSLLAHLPAAYVLALAATVALADGDTTLIAKLGQANARFRGASVSTAQGYSLIACASSPTGSAMGIHYVNAAYLKNDAVNVAKPHMVIYEPRADGRLVLAGVEYIASKGAASLEGQLLNLNSQPNRYGIGPFHELYGWAWKNKPKGMFADNNPRVSCDGAKAASQ